MAQATDVVPRATYMPYPFEIIQNPHMIGMRYAFARAVRTIRLDGKSRDWLEGWPDFWMGDSRGRWEGDTLVLDVRKLDENSWLDHAGDLGRKTAMAQIGQPLRRYTVKPLHEPVSPTPERIVPPPPIKSPEEAPPVKNPKPEPVRQRNLCPT